MSGRNFGIEALNAYVDGELSSGEAAEVARAAVRSSALAAQIATLREMKAAVSDLAPDIHASLPEEPRRRFGMIPAAAVACVAAIVVLVGVLAGLLREDDRPDWPSVLESHHRSWAFNQVAQSGSAQPVQAGAGWAQTLDLSSARLTFAGRERIAFRDMTLDRVGYEGTRGCRLSLFRLPGALQVSGEMFAPPTRVRVWREDDHDFLLMAEGMAVSRFDELANAIAVALRERRPFDADTRDRLARARAMSRPCRA